MVRARVRNIGTAIDRIRSFLGFKFRVKVGLG
jgi:hypothetical protein